MTCYKTPLWDFNTDRTTSTREHLRPSHVYLSPGPPTPINALIEKTQGGNIHTQNTTLTTLEYAISPILEEKESAILKTTTSKCGSPTCTSYRTAYDLTLNSWRFLSCQLSWCRRPWPHLDVGTSHGVLIHTQNSRCCYCTTGRNVPRSSGV